MYSSPTDLSIFLLKVFSCESRNPNDLKGVFRRQLGNVTMLVSGKQPLRTDDIWVLRSTNYLALFSLIVLFPQSFCSFSLVMCCRYLQHFYVFLCVFAWGDGKNPAAGKIKHIVNHRIIFDYINCRLAKDEVLTCIDHWLFFNTFPFNKWQLFHVVRWDVGAPQNAASSPPGLLHIGRRFPTKTFISNCNWLWLGWVSASPKCLLTLLPRLWQTQMLTTNEVASKGRMHLMGLRGGAVRWMGWSLSKFHSQFFGQFP